MHAQNLARVAITIALSTVNLTFIQTQANANTNDSPGLPPVGYSPHSISSNASINTLSRYVQDFGRIQLSLDAIGTLGPHGVVSVNKPPNGRVRKAYLASATTGFTSYRLAVGDVSLAGSPVVWDSELPNSISSYNYWADVTAIVKPIVDAAPTGLVDLTISEINTLQIDGEILAVILDDPTAATDRTVFLYFGAQNVTGDSFTIDLDSPVDTSDPNLKLTYSLGISYGYQATDTSQWSQIDVNGVRLTSSAGGQDDGDNKNGALITVGGLGDDPTNPPDPAANSHAPRTDDELYDLKPFVRTGDTSIRVDTVNPSVDDNILLAALSLEGTQGVVTVNLDVSLYNNPDATTRAKYENIMRYFADGLYESSNGTHKLSQVTFHINGDYQNDADIVWVNSCHPNSHVSGYNLPGLHINMCDIFHDASDYDFLVDDAHQKGGGYTLAHEFGHLYFGLYDEYRGDNPTEPSIATPLSTDTSVANSIMSKQWNALDGDLNWLNFSVAKNATAANAQQRVYGNTGWETLTRPVKDDPQDGQRLALPKRQFHSELIPVKPEPNTDPAIELPGTARSNLRVVWPPAGLTTQQVKDQNFSGQVISLNGQNMAGPTPLVLLTFVHDALYLTDIGISATLQLPNGLFQKIMFTDDGIAPDALRGDGLYSAIAGYSLNGIYTVTVNFDNNSGTAKKVSGSAHTALPNGEAGPPQPAIPVTDSFTINTQTLIAISNAGVDDYANTPINAANISADNTPYTGKIHFAGDHDVFSMTVPTDKSVVRVTGLALGMQPHLRIFQSNGTSVIGDVTQSTSCGIDYLAYGIPVSLAGQTIFVEVSDVVDSTSGTLYELSAGPKLPSDGCWHMIYLPMLGH